MRRGHVPLLHIWPATRPTAACRAVICAALWPDPHDELCPQAFCNQAAKVMLTFAESTQGDKEVAEICSEESWKRYLSFLKNNQEINTKKKRDLKKLRQMLLDFIGDFAAFEASTHTEFLRVARNITQAAHEALGGIPGTRPLVVDPFAGGGAIPLEALRVGVDAFASDLNPVAVLLCKTVLEYVPKYGRRLAAEVGNWINWIQEEAERKLGDFYPRDKDGSKPIAYLWARTITCEGPGCGIEVPLIRSLWLARKRKEPVALQLIPEPRAKRIEFGIIENARSEDVKDGTIRRSAATCPCCGYTTPVASVRRQMIGKNGGANDSRLLCVVTVKPNERGRFYRTPTNTDIKAAKAAESELERLCSTYSHPMSLIPEEPTPLGGGKGAGRAFGQRLYGLDAYKFAFTSRQLLALTTMMQLTKSYCASLGQSRKKEYHEAVHTVLALVLDKMVDMNAALCVWQTHAEIPAHVFSRWAWPTVWDFAEANPLAGSSGSPVSSGKRTVDGITHLAQGRYLPGKAIVADACTHPLPDACAQMFGTDPPYYDAIPYADISDFFYVWLKRALGDLHKELFQSELSNKDNECIVDDAQGKDKAFFQKTMTKAMTEGRRLLAPNGIGFIVFAHKSTAGWEAQLQAIIESGWIITSSWPIDTEMASRFRAKGSAALASSIHLVCRPRANLDDSPRTDDVGDWRDVLAELPQRIKERMPRLASEGVVGADAIFACLGPALEVYSRYSLVEKVSGEKVELKEYLEQVWAAVSREALNMIFEGADASGFEEDARLTAMWLWTLRTSVENEKDKDGENGKTRSVVGYNLEYDAARKIAQGIGAHLENLGHLVMIKGGTATLLSAGARTRYLFGKDADEAPKGRARKKSKQLKLDFEGEWKQMEEESGDWTSDLAGRAGSTVLDQLHQSMILFGAGRGEALKRFLVEDGVGGNPLYWRLAQALSALYPSGTDEKRWVDGVLARKKGLGF